MRIIGGEFGGRRINPPTKMPYTRPTTDIAKEGLFNMLQHQIDFEGISTLDIFGGTGSISYELASRGATQQIIVEKDTSMHAFIKKTAESLGIQHLQVVKMDVFKFLEQCNDTFDFIFAGPPYALTTIDELPRIIVQKKLLKKGGIFVLEHTPRNNYQQFEWFVKERNYGTTIFSFFSEPGNS
ncbi:RsmD family RNA methyltransferase [Gynurincola endophyticus]|uniref:RsmD family RNA methyltransferase n=1 Tax=Gynurincola endophyticus TaxID=2479004 RepID=UPI000F8CBB28|nr:RsmD family RNA methyltransferase [Gynurincola endophyticus]